MLYNITNVSLAKYILHGNGVKTVEHSTSKHNRVLVFCTRLLEGEVLSKAQEAERFGVAPRSIQRDIDDLRSFFAEKTAEDGLPRELVYSAKRGGYYLDTGQRRELTNGEALAVCKVLLESRGFRKDELMPMLDKIIIGCVPKTQVAQVRDLLLNEQHCYIEPRHGVPLVETLWQLGQAVREQRLIWVDYEKMKGRETVRRRLQPVGIMFSEFYFYLTAFIENIDKAEVFEEKDDLFPTIYRIDRIRSVEVMDEHFAVPYKDRFQEGEFRKRVQFMYGGKLKTITFTYSGPSLDAVLDRLPTAQVLGEKDGVYTIRAEVFGKGIDMWLRSQGGLVCEIE